MSNESDHTRKPQIWICTDNVYKTYILYTQNKDSSSIVWIIWLLYPLESMPS